MTALRHLRLVAFLEGTSFLALLFIAMPLKYLAGLPLAVRIARRQLDLPHSDN